MGTPGPARGQVSSVVFFTPKSTYSSVPYDQHHDGKCSHQAMISVIWTVDTMVNEHDNAKKNKKGDAEGT